jgi:hypothetical protein
MMPTPQHLNSVTWIFLLHDYHLLAFSEHKKEVTNQLISSLKKEQNNLHELEPCTSTLNSTKPTFRRTGGYVLLLIPILPTIKRPSRRH